MPLVYKLSEMIEQAYRLDEAYMVIVYGPLGYGKSSYACQVLAELYGDHDASPLDPRHWNWEAVKRRIFFHPRDYLSYIMSHGGREPAVIWDDAGVWLHSLDWAERWVKTVGKYLQVARTDFAGLIFTTPTPRVLMRKIRDIPAAITVKIVKEQSDYVRRVGGVEELVKPRIARMFRTWMTPDMKRTGVREIGRDQFNAMLPDRFFKWYRPYRDRYASLAQEMAMRRLKEALEKHPDDYAEGWSDGSDDEEAADSPPAC